jgi:hypothetical protein
LLLHIWENLKFTDGADPRDWTDVTESAAFGEIREEFIGWFLSPIRATRRS